MDSGYIGINKAFCRNSNGAILVADIMNEKSLDDLAKWKKEIDDLIATDGTSIPMVLALNKFDLVQEKEEAGEQLNPFQTQEQIEEFA